MQALQVHSSDSIDETHLLAPASRVYVSRGLSAVVRAVTEASADDMLLHDPKRPVNRRDAPLPSSATQPDPNKQEQYRLRE